MKTVEEMYSHFKDNVMGDSEYPPVIITLSRISFDAGVMALLKELHELGKNNDLEGTKKFIKQTIEECTTSAERAANNAIRRN